MTPAKSPARSITGPDEDLILESSSLEIILAIVVLPYPG